MNQETSAFWRSGSAGRLRVQKCDDCGRFAHPPASICYACDGRDLSFAAVSGRGTVYSWTWIHQAPPEHISGGDDRGPYLVAQVELDDQPGLFVYANLPSLTDPDSLRVGLPVTAMQRPADRDAVPDFAVL